MRTAFNLAARQSWRRAGAAKSVTLVSILGMTIAVVVVVLALTFGAEATSADECAARPDNQQGMCRAQLGLTFFGAMGTPGVVLVIALTLISAGARRRELSELRLIGVSRRVCGLIAVFQTIFLVCVGLVLGLILYYLLLGVGEGTGTISPGLATGLRPTAGELTLASLIVLGSAIMAALAGVARTSDSLAAARIQHPSGRPRNWRALPLTLGLVGLGITILLSAKSPSSPLIGLGLITGLLISAIGLVIFLPLLLHLLGSALAGPLATPALRIAGRSMQVASSDASRLLAVFLIAVILSIFGLGMWQSIARQDDRQAAINAETTGPNLAHVTFQDPQLIDVFDDLNIIQVVFPLLLATPTEPMGEENSYGNVSIGTCMNFRSLVGDPDAPCSNEHATVFRSAYSQITLTGRELAIQGRPETVKITADLDLDYVDYEATMVGDLKNYGPIVLHLPPIATDMDPTLSHDWLIVLPPGNELITELDDTLEDLGGYALSLTGGPHVYAETMRYQSIVYTVMLVILVTSGLGLVMALIDHALTRRDPARRLSNLGVPSSVIRRSLTAEIVVPLIVGMMISAGIGWMSAYISAHEDLWAVDMSNQVTRDVLGIAALVGLTVIIAMVGVVQRKISVPRRQI